MAHKAILLGVSGPLGNKYLQITMEDYPLLKQFGIIWGENDEGFLRVRNRGLLPIKSSEEKRIRSKI